MRLASDIETNGFLDVLTCIHCIVNIDVDTGQVWRYGPHGVARTHGLPLDGIRQLETADQIIMHNGIKFDIPAIEKVTGINLKKSLGVERIRDSLVESRLIYSNIKDFDMANRHRWGLPPKFFGSFALKAWGYRLGVLKGEFGETSDWQHFTPEMLDYCEQDVVVTVALVKKLDAKIAEFKEVGPALLLEHRTAWLMAQQERNGFHFNEKKAVQLYSVLTAERIEAERRVSAQFGGWFSPNLGAKPDVFETYFDDRPIKFRCKIPKRTVKAAFGSKAQATIAGVPFTPVKWVDFNPTSRQHIARVLQKKGWKPTEFTETGDPKIDEAVLEKLPYPEAKLLARLFMLQKRIGMLAEGDQAWLKAAKGGRIHGSVNPNGAVTGRATHSWPNIAQVPASGSEFGKECRELFTVPAGWILLGSDASGLELRCLGHYMARFDGGAYIREILEGDIHTANQLAAGLEQRAQAKTFIYAFLYGAGDVKIGSIVKPFATEAVQRRIGKALKEKFLQNTPALKALRELVASAAKKGFLKGLDGRRVYVRSAHAALNTLLQSAGALICKLWICEMERLALAAGLHHGWGGDFAFCAWVHDEVQIACRTPEIAQQLGAISKQAMKLTEAAFSFTCPLDAEFAIGSSWAETH